MVPEVGDLVEFVPPWDPILPSDRGRLFVVTAVRPHARGLFFTRALSASPSSMSHNPALYHDEVRVVIKRWTLLEDGHDLGG